MKVVTKVSRGQKRCSECSRVCAARLIKCECGHVFNRKRKTLWAIFDEIGNRTSIPEVQKRYKKATGQALVESEISKLRKDWTVQQGKLPLRDCRTLKDVPRRNMLRDDKVSQPVFDKLMNYMDVYGLDPEDFVQNIRSFHSVPQLMKAIHMVASLRQIVKRAA